MKLSGGKGGEGDHLVNSVSAIRASQVRCLRRSSYRSRLSLIHISTGRYAALKVLTVGDKIVYAVLDGIFTERPNLGQVAHSPVLRNKHFNFKDTPALHLSLIHI